MRKQRFHIAIIITLFLILITFGIIFWLPYFFVDEFCYIDISYKNNQLIISTNPENLFDKKISRWTDVQATWKNDSQKSCEVEIKSQSIQESFDLEPGLQYGLFLPKDEEISISFCDIERDIYLNN